MNRAVPRVIVLGVACLVAGQALAAEDLETRVKKAESAARANAASAAGREWMRLHKSATGRLMIPVLNACLPEGGEIPTVFSLYLRLSQKGRVLEVVTDIDAALGTCMTAGASEVQLPDAPREDYWIQLNMAAPM